MDQERNELRRVSDDGESPDAVSTAAGVTGGSKSGDYPTSETRETDEDAADATEEPEQIRAEIEQTRSKMSETIDAIQEKLSFSNIADQVKEQVSDQISNVVETAKGAVYEATIGKAGNFMQNVGRGLSGVTENVGSALNDTGLTVARSARRNPLPLALIGLGVGMLIMQNSRRSRARSYEYDYDYDYDYDSGRYRESGSSARNQDRSRRDNQRDNQEGLLTRAGETASNVATTAYSGVSSAASTAYSGVSNAAGSAYEKVGSIGTQARRVAGQAQNQYEYYLEENPLAVGAVALALGAAVGFTIPSTEYENEMMGEYRENLVQKAQDVARDAIDKVQQVAGEVSRTVSDQVQNQNNIQ